MTNSAVRRGMRRTARVVVALPLIGLALALAAVAVPHFFGASTLVVRSGSMGRAAPIGSIVVTRTVPAAEVRIGSIVAVHPAGASANVPPTVHRVIELHQTPEGISVITKGDANPSADPDPHVLAGQVRTVWFDLPWLGYLVANAQTRVGWVLLIILPGTILCTLFLVDLWRPVLEADDEDGTDGADEGDDGLEHHCRDIEEEARLRREVADLRDDVARLETAVAVARRQERSPAPEAERRFSRPASAGSDLDTLRMWLEVVTEERDALLADDRTRPAYWRALMRKVVESSEETHR